MTMVLPSLNFSLVVEFTTNIEEYVFMTIDNAEVISIGDAVKAHDKQSPFPVINKYSSLGNSEMDRYTLDFGNISVSYFNKLIIQ